MPLCAVRSNDGQCGEGHSKKVEWCMVMRRVAANSGDKDTIEGVVKPETAIV